MNRKMKRLLCLLMVMTMVFTATQSTFAASKSELGAAITDTAAFIHDTVKSPEIGSTGGEWAVIGLARSGYNVPEEYYQNYYKAVEDYLKAQKGILHDKKLTEYSRVIVALASIGKDSRNVSGYNLTTALGDYDKTVWQGINGPIWALIALDSANYPMPVNKDAKVLATRDMYVQNILDNQFADGGWSLLKTSDPDMTGMALQALANYKDRAEVKTAIDKALSCMSKLQDADGGFSSGNASNSESCVQMITGLSALGIPLDDVRFVKNGKTIMDKLMTFYEKGNGFKHVGDKSGSNQMATEQGLYGMVAAQRLTDGKNSLFNMSDSIKIGSGTSSEGNSNLGKKVNVPAVSLTGKTFSDIKSHKNQSAIEMLISRQIINGKTDTTFEPNSTMTRAEFAVIVVKALGLKPEENSKFTDVKSGEWYASFVGTVSDEGIVTGKSPDVFDPQGTISREEAAAMVARAAKLCGMDTAYDTNAVRDILAGFTDYVKCSSWAMEPLAFCYDKNILDDTQIVIIPQESIKRCEVAQMLYNMISAAKLF